MLSRPQIARSFAWLIVVSFVSCLALWIVALTGCAPQSREDPPVFWNQTRAQKQLAAALHAKDVQGILFDVMATGSMEPLITGGDVIVVRPTKDVKEGRVYTYRTKWAPVPVTHRCAVKHGTGWIFSGDANRYSESGDLTVYADQIIGEVVGIYTERTR